MKAGESLIQIKNAASGLLRLRASASEAVGRVAAALERSAPLTWVSDARSCVGHSRRHMAARILILDGHPDPTPRRFIHALADAYCEGAQSAGHEVLLVRLADLEFPLLRSREDYNKGEPADSVRRVQSRFDWATHVVILYPLWLGEMPAMLKGLLEQMLRPGFAFSTKNLGRWPVKLQGGKRARIVVTMGMPAPIYRFWYGAHSLRSLERNILKFIGFRRVRKTLIGGVETIGDEKRKEWLGTLRTLGGAAR